MVILEGHLGAQNRPQELRRRAKNDLQAEKREEGGPIGAPERPESRFIGPVDVLECLQARGSLQANSGQLGGDPPEDTTYQKIFVYLEV